LGQINLFNEEVKEDWEKEWLDMPEFVQENEGAYKQLIVSFRNEEDLKTFLKLINQKITKKTKSIWFPQDDRDKPSNYLYTYIET